MSDTQLKADPVVHARAIAADVLAPRAAHHDATGEFPTQAVAALGGAGLLGLLVPSEYGGVDASYETFVEVVEILARACASTAMIFVMHHCQYAMVVDHGTARQKEAFLPPSPAARSSWRPPPPSPRRVATRGSA